MRSIRLLYVVVALLTPHYAWSPSTVLVVSSPSQLWRAKNKLRLSTLGFLRWLPVSSANCASWVSFPSPTGGSSDDDDQEIAIRRRCAADILALMGGAEQRESVKASRAQELLSYIRFLVPVEEKPKQSRKSVRKSAAPRNRNADFSKEQIWKLVREPPPSVAELARKSVEWAGEPEAVLTDLDSTLYKVPDVEGSSANKCVLTKHDYGKRFAKQEINAYLAFLFEAIVVLAPSIGLNVSLNRYDLFHGHMFTDYDTGRLGILFHSREYPEFDKNSFPLNLGYCQAGSEVPYDESINFRNIVWLAPMPSCTGNTCSNKWLASGALFLLDATPGGVIYKELVSEWVDFVRTIYESDFGRSVIDVNYFNVDALQRQIFLT